MNGFGCILFGLIHRSRSANVLLSSFLSKWKSLDIFQIRNCQIDRVLIYRASNPFIIYKSIFSLVYFFNHYSLSACSFNRIKCESNILWLDNNLNTNDRGTCNVMFIQCHHVWCDCFQCVGNDYKSIIQFLFKTRYYYNRGRER